MMSEELRMCQNCKHFSKPIEQAPCNVCNHVTVSTMDHWVPQRRSTIPSDISTLDASEKLQLMRRLINHAETVKAIMVATGAAQLTTQVSTDIVLAEGLFKELYLSLVDKGDLSVGDDCEEEDDDETTTEM